MEDTDKLNKRFKVLLNNYTYNSYKNYKPKRKNVS